MSVRKTLNQLMARRHQKMFKLLVQMVGDEISIKVAWTLNQSKYASVLLNFTVCSLNTTCKVTNNFHDCN